MQLGQPEKITQAGYNRSIGQQNAASPSRSLAKTLASSARPKEIGKSSRQDSTGDYVREARQEQRAQERCGHRHRGRAPWDQVPCSQERHDQGQRRATSATLPKLRVIADTPFLPLPNSLAITTLNRSNLTANPLPNYPLETASS